MFEETFSLEALFKRREKKTKQTKCLPRDEDYFGRPRAVQFEVQRVTFQGLALVLRFRHRTETLASACSRVMSAYPLLRYVLAGSHDSDSLSVCECCVSPCEPERKSKPK